MRNIEIKARVKDIRKLLQNAKQLTGTEGTILKQHDTFYNTFNGRLKLRRLPDMEKAQLIYYNRPDSEGPKLSSYETVEVSSKSSEDLHGVLSKALGPKMDVKKTRHLFLYESTRIHIDEVENLGSFMELEVCLNPDQSEDEGSSIAQTLMEKLEVQKEDLISNSYADLLTSIGKN